VKYLLDTCAFIWFATDSNKLSATASSIIRNPANDCSGSTVSLWEISMKSVVGKLTVPGFPASLEAIAVTQGLTVLPLTVAHVESFNRLSPVPRDAFDRILAAISLVEDFTLVSPEEPLDSLGITRIW
jgi:PIN domain nuclease of toxin-antitoxin system